MHRKHFEEGVGMNTLYLKWIESQYLFAFFDNNLIWLYFDFKMKMQYAKTSFNVVILRKLGATIRCLEVHLVFGVLAINFHGSKEYSIYRHVMPTNLVTPLWLPRRF